MIPRGRDPNIPSPQDWVDPLSLPQTYNFILSRYNYVKFPTVPVSDSVGNQLVLFINSRHLTFIVVADASLRSS
jgi:hypothetical protein